MEKNTREIQEAIAAGERALDSLYEARERLRSARSFGMLDLLGGGFFTDLFKHNKMNEAVRCMEKAKEQLKIFQRELSDLCLSVDLRMEVGGFLSFAEVMIRVFFFFLIPLSQVLAFLLLRISFSTVLWRIIWCSPKSRRQENRSRTPLWLSQIPSMC